MTLLIHGIHKGDRRRAPGRLAARAAALSRIHPRLYTVSPALAPGTDGGCASIAGQE
jgi:hypothetical protein